MRWTFKGIVSRSDARALVPDVELEYLKMGRDGYTKLYAWLTAEPRTPRERVNALTLLFLSRGWGDLNEFFALCLRYLGDADVPVRSTAARFVVALLTLRAEVPVLTGSEVANAVSALRAALSSGLDRVSTAQAERFLTMQPADSG